MEEKTKEMIKEETNNLKYNFETDKVYEGFRCIKSENIKDIKSTGFVFEHEKTKAKLVYIQNKDTNKVFSIGFRTPPTNDTGIPHILEHSVLCGSKNYPVKEPFVELLKGSVNTFLNAMTMPDMTLYPIASTNEKDYMNLMNVYLDAVFYPNIYNKKEIFMQEGWHYELLDKKSPLTYKGVVYNEMKGVYSSPEATLFYESIKSLYPDTIYSNEYGGYPDEIPNLTYEEFIAFHEKYYHPSNSYIYIYGDLNPNECLKEINEKYLSNFEYKEIDSKINLQEVLNTPVEVEKPYAVENDSEDITKKSIMSLNYSVATSMNIELNFAFKMLETYLLELSASPLKKVVLEKGLCNDMYGFFENDLLQPFFSINIIEMKKDDKDLIIENIKNELERIVKEGIDLELMEGVINRIEFAYRRMTEGDPLGLHYNYTMYQTWLYDGDALAPLYFEESIKTIRDKFKNGYFENLIKEYMLENTHSSTILLVPDKDLKEKKEQKLKEKLEGIKNRMSDKELNDIIKNTKNLIKLQAKPDSKKDLETIPTLKIEDITKEAEEITIDKEILEDIKVYKKECETNKIAYIDFVFDTKYVTKENIPYLNLLANVLSEVSTKNMHYDEISKKVGMAAGDIDFGIEVLCNHKDADEFNTSLTCHMEMLEDKHADMIKIAKDIVNNTIFNEDAKIKEVISRLRVSLEQTLVQNGHVTVAKRIQSYFSAAGKYGDMISGFKFYEFINELDNKYDEMKEEVKTKLEEIKNVVFRKENLHSTVVCENGMYDKIKLEIKDFIASLDNNTIDESIEINKDGTYDFEIDSLNEGIMTQSDVQYVGLGGNFRKLGYEYKGSIHVLKNILEYDYLWNLVRVKGGAYGSKLMTGITGDFIFASYRDPNLSETYSNYKKVVSYLKSFKKKDNFEKYIIGTIGAFDKPINPYNKAKVAERRDLRGITHKEIQEERDEILNTTPKEIKKYAKMLNDILKQNMICTLGNERKIKECKNIFKTLRTLKENK